MEELRDIKGLMSIEDYSLYLFVATAILFLIILYFIARKIIRRAETSTKKAKKVLKDLDLSDSKIASYMLTKHGKILKNEDFVYLEKYKYKKEVADFSDEDLTKIKGFLDGI